MRLALGVKRAEVALEALEAEAAEAVDIIVDMDMDMDMDAELEAEDAEAAVLLAVAVAVLVAPCTWKPALKLYSDGLVSSMIWMKTLPMGTSAGMVKVAEPVLGMLAATTMPSVGRMSPLVWILTVTVLDGKGGGGG